MKRLDPTTDDLAIAADVEAGSTATIAVAGPEGAHRAPRRRRGRLVAVGLGTAALLTAGVAVQGAGASATTLPLAAASAGVAQRLPAPSGGQSLAAAAVSAPAAAVPAPAAVAPVTAAPATSAPVASAPVAGVSAPSAGAAATKRAAPSTKTAGTVAAAPAAATTDPHLVGVVDVDADLGGGVTSAGTGMVIRSDGIILTNNHVLAGSNSVTVTLVTTGQTFAAAVVGTNPTADVAVLRINLTGMATVTTSTTANVTPGASILAVGNAGGNGGAPSQAYGHVVATGQSISAMDSSGDNVEQLSNLIQTDAAISAGDSGGPLFDGNGRVIGMDTAATSSAGYAITIGDAMAAAQQIL